MSGVVLNMTVFCGGISNIIASDKSVAYELEKRRDGVYDVVKYIGENVKTRCTGTYIRGKAKGQRAALDIIEEDFGSEIIPVRSQRKRRTSEQKRRDNFVLYD